MKRTAKQIETSKRNGAKSHGPVTAEGKERSSRNAITHGLTASVVLLDNEDPEAFNHLLASYRETWQPVGGRESDLVQLLAADAWRLNRILSSEAGALHNQIENDRARVDREWNTPAEQLHTDLAINAILDRLDKYSRLETRIRRASAQTTKELRALQSDRRKRESEIVQNEPGDEQPARNQTLALVRKPQPAAVDTTVAPHDDIPAVTRKDSEEIKLQ